MDISEYLHLFLADAREQLENLNLAVVRIEESPDDRETVDEIFRIAHSLKGSSATMGFAGMAALTHEMEDVFELFKQRTGGLSREAIDVLFECLDVLSACVDAIEDGGSEEIEPDALIAKLKSLVRERSEEQEEEREIPDAEPPVMVAAADGQRVVHVVVRLSEDAVMPSVRAYMVLAALGDHGEIVASLPTQDAVEEFENLRIEAWVATDHESEALAKAAADVPDVAEASAAEAPPEAAAGEEPEAVEEAEAAPLEEKPVERAKAKGAAAQKREEDAARKGATTVRVDAERLDQLMHYMGELVVHRTRVESICAGLDIPDLHQAVQDLTRASQSLQYMVMQVRMIPVEAVFLRFPRLVRDLSQKLDKQVELVMVGQETELDRTVVDALGGPMVHLVRNALDHGLESPAEREAAGKPATGTVEISARHIGGNVVISVKDDGRGIDPERVARKAVERGLIPEEAAADIDQARAAELLFAPGFSTADEATDISGRGVGMDAVRTTMRELGGEVTLNSVKGEGTTAQIRLPLTLAIIAALLVESNELPFAIPLDRVERTVRISDHAVRSVAGEKMLMLRDGVIPLVDSGKALGSSATTFDHAVLVRGGDGLLALGVERLVGQRELVTRALPPEAADRSAVSGGAVMANGEIALIVDCDALTTGGGALVGAAA
jgi:two-component system, chemotaxis family, sensor kinase CheA